MRLVFEKVIFKERFNEIYVDSFKECDSIIKRNPNLFNFAVFTLVKLLMMILVIILTPFIFFWYVLLSSIKIQRSRA